MRNKKIDKKRNQTLIFLELAKSVRSVVLIDEIKIPQRCLKYATSILIKSISNALDDNRDLNCMIKYGSDNNIIKSKIISARLTVSYENECSCSGVYSTIIKNTDKMSPIDIYRAVSEMKHKGLEKLDNYQKIKIIQKLPYLIAKWLAKFLFYFHPTIQQEFFGSFTVTSLGKKSIKMCIPISGSTFTFQLGYPQYLDNSDFLLNITMVYDHRILDGIQASDLLNKIKSNFSKYMLNLG